MAWTYSDWPTLATPALQLARLNLHIAEVADKVSNETSADGYSRGSSSLAQLLTQLYAERTRLSNTSGASGCMSRARFVRRGQ